MRIRIIICKKVIKLLENNGLSVSFEGWIEIRGKMLGNFTDDLRAWVLKYFPERQVYLRSGGEVNYYTFGTKIQVAACSAVGVLAIYFVVTVANIATGNNPFTKASKQNKLMKAEYERLLEDAEARYADSQLQLSQQREAFELAVENFQAKHAVMAEFISQPAEDLSQVMKIASLDQGQILMHPVVRDTLERQPLQENMTTKMAYTGTSLDLPFDALDNSQNSFLFTAEESTLENIELKRSIIEATELNVDTVMGAGLFGRGGPAGVETDVAPNRVDNIRARSNESEKLDEILTSMPLRHPVSDDHYQTSGYGVRKDPFTRRPTMHSGIDIASYKNAPIVSAADGKVIFAGRNGGYGLMIEIDHGHGFKTRYAHLSKTNVKRGQPVDSGEKVGSMGSSGRSTSTHLHYEVEFQGKKLNPNKFLKAGRYVHQN